MNISYVPGSVLCDESVLDARDDLYLDPVFKWLKI